MKKFLILILAMTFVISTAYSETWAVRSECEQSINKLEKALKEHNFGLVEDLLHEDFDYAGLGCGGHCNSSKMVASMVISTYPHKVKAIKLKDVQSEGPDYRANATFHYLDNRDNSEKEAEFSLLMTEEGHFLEMELPGIKLLMPGQETEQTESGCSSCEKEG